jgi:diguanylate cyclase (GGDEF)-like protein
MGDEKRTRPPGPPASEPRLEVRLREAEEVLDAIRSDGIDAFVVTTPAGERVVLADRGVERPYRMMVDGMSEGAATVGPDGTVLYVNRRLAEMLETSSDDLVGRSFFGLIESAPGSLVSAVVEAGCGAEWRGEVVLVGAASGAIPAQMSLTSLSLGDGSVARAVLLTDLRDRQRTAAVVAAGQLAQRIFDQASEAVVVCDEDGIVRQANQEALRLVGGVDPQGTPFDVAFELEFEAGVASVEDLLARHTQRIRARMPGPDGPLHLLVSASRLTGADGRRVAAVVTLTDLTELQHATRQLERHARQQRSTADLSRAALEGAALGELGTMALAALREQLDGCEVRVSRLIPGADAAPETVDDPVSPNGVAHVIRAGDSVLGELLIDPGPARVLPLDDLDFVDNVVSLLCLAAEQHVLHDRLRHQAHHDALTGLPNRVLLEDRLQQAMARAARDGTSVAVLFIDLDRFKYVNDTLGHEAGNAVLVQVGKRLRRHVRTTDTVARVGGDEFVVVHADLKRPEDALGVAGVVVDTLERPFRVGDRNVNVRATVGISTFPQDGHKTGTLLTKSDSAMYHGKRSGRNLVRFFTEDMTEFTAARLEMEHEFQAALIAGDLELHFQPQVCAGTGVIRGVEALARWKHPRHGWIPPSRFVPVVEDMGLVIEFGTWALGEACRQAARWIDVAGGPSRVSVNVSPTQIARPDFADVVRRALRAAGLKPANLELEVTESIMMHDLDTVTRGLSHLRELGVTIALDDYGLGYASVSYLRSLPLDRLKVDKSFVDATDDTTAARHDQQAVLAAITTMAQALSLQVTVEGVETAAQLELARSVGSDEVQGYLFGHAAPAEGIDRLMASTAEGARASGNRESAPRR